METDLQHPQDRQSPRKRLFIALLPDDATRDALQETERLLEPVLEKSKPSPRDNLHLTLAFLGMQDDAGEKAARRAIERAADTFGATAAPRTILGPIGCFTRRRGGAVLWRGLAENAETQRIRTLREHLRGCLAEQGIVPDAAFTPHFTLARGAHPLRHADETNAQAWERICRESTKEAPQAEFAATRISLMLSHRPEPEHRLVYTEVFAVPLGGIAAGSPPRKPGGK